MINQIIDYQLFKNESKELFDPFLPNFLSVRLTKNNKKLVHITASDFKNG
jgi:hypothetical protein